MSDCIFCSMIKDDHQHYLYEDDKLIVIKDINPKAAVHLLVITKEHIPSLNELAPDHGQVIADIFQLLPKLAKENGLETGFRTIVNTGPGGGQEIAHLHFHLLGGSKLPA